MRFETAPGRQAQVDWGSTWADIGGQRMRVQLLVMVLGYSRRLYVECTRDQTLGSLLACHQHAFDWFGGLTEEILYDNPKTVVLKRDWDGRVIEWHPQFWDFAPVLWLHAAPVSALPGADEREGGIGHQVRQAQFRPGAPVSRLGRA